MTPFWRPPERGLLYIFVHSLKLINRIMTEIVPLIIIVSLLLLTVFLLVRNVRYRAFDEDRDYDTPVILGVNSLLVIADVMVGGDLGVRISLDLILLIMPLTFISSALWNPVISRKICRCSLCVQLLMGLCYLLCRYEVLEIPPTEHYVIYMVSVALLFVGLMCRGIWTRIRNTRGVMKDGTVLHGLGLEVDMVYVMMLLLIPLLMLATVVLGNDYSGFIWFILVLELLHVAAICVRLVLGSYFVICQDHERRIMESLKISQVEIASGDKPDNYRELYERIVEYFEKEKPFLDSKLTINDIVKVVFSNKVYISRAISQYTGRNFCQFVNYYRIAYSVECFRMNPELRITEMAELSGFNSVVSYNMAFHLFMHENPSDWCRKERYKLRYKKK